MPIDTSPKALRNLAIRLENAAKWRGDVLDEAAATLHALAGCLDGGYALVPREPTEEMYAAACDPQAIFKHSTPEERGGKIPLLVAVHYRAMIAAGDRALAAKEPGPPALAQTRGDMVLMDARVISRLFEALQIYNTDSNWVMGGIFDPNSPKFEGPLVAFRALKGAEED
jgi:hypothetical protein